MSDPSWSKLHDGETYKIYEDYSGLYERLFMRYTVAAPSGRVVTCTMTLRGAHRAIRKDKRRASSPSWWDKPIVGEVPRG